jgi:hypothetical protein
LSFKERRAQTATNYIEPAVAWNIPIRSKIAFNAELPRNFRFNHIVTSFSNHLENFANPFLEKRLFLSSDKRQMYDFISERYQDLYADDVESILSLRMFETTYNENIFPKHRNVGLNKTRTRIFFDEKRGYQGYDARASDIRTFWSASRERTNWSDIPDNETALNSLGYPTRRSSVWALEYVPKTKENIDLRGDLTWAGDAQYNGYTYNYKTNESTLIEQFNAEDENAWLAPRANLQFIYNPRSIKAKENAWLWKAAEISKNTPWYDDYASYSEDIRAIGQNYSITPEFNISKHIDFYTNQNGGSLTVDNKNILELPGAFKSDSDSGVLSRIIGTLTGTTSERNALFDSYKIENNNALGWVDIFSAKYIFSNVLDNYVFNNLSRNAFT